MCFLAPLLVSACATPVEDHTLDITYDPCVLLVLEPAADATEAQRQSIEDAAALWREVLPTRIAVGGDGAGDAPRLPIGFDDASLAFRGVYRDERGDILINRGITDPRARTLTIAHEMGHAFGLWHVSSDERSSVMNAGAVDVAPTAEDSDAVRAVWMSCQP